MSIFLFYYALKRRVRKRWPSNGLIENILMFLQLMLLHFLQVISFNQSSNCVARSLFKSHMDK